MDHQGREYHRFNSSGSSVSGDVFEPTLNNNAKQRGSLIEWLNSTLPGLNLPVNASDEELRALLVDGSILCMVLNKLRPGSIAEGGTPNSSSEARSENVRRFLTAMDDIGLPRFQLSDLEKGSMKIVLECLLTLKAHFMPSIGGNPVMFSPNNKSASDANMRWKQLVDQVGSGEASPGELSPRTYASIVAGGDDRRKSWSDSKFQRALRSPVMAEPSAALMHHVGHKFHEVFQLKQGGYADLPAAKLTEMMKSNSLDLAPTQSLLSVVNGILDESIQRKSGEIPHRVACLLRKVVQEIERRICTQAEHLRTQNNLFKAREEKYQSRLRVLEALVTGTNEETQVVTDQLQQVKTKMKIVDEKRKNEEQKNEERKNEERKNEEQKNEVRKNEERKNEDRKIEERKNEDRKIEERKNEDRINEERKIEARKNEVQKNEDCNNEDRKIEERKNEDRINEERKVEERKIEDRINEERKIEARKVEDRINEERRIEARKVDDRINEERKIEARKKEQELERLMNEMDDYKNEISSLKQELEIARKARDEWSSQMEADAKKTQQELEQRLKEVLNHLTESKKKVKDLEAFTELESQGWNKKAQMYQILSEFQLGVLRELRYSSQSVRQEILQTQKSYSEEFDRLGTKIKALQGAADNYYKVLFENQKLHNELQELKGNIRVYCRIRPFLPGQSGKQSIIEYIGENGELTVANPSKQGKEGRRSFKFNKVYGPEATQAGVFADTQPLIQSVVDGYNVCIFAYGQTGSGKTYTMSGPDNGSKEDWGVNYRALNDLFQISQTRQGAYTYEVGVQMVEIYNEQVRDLLSTDPQKRLGILATSQPNGLAVPDASMLPVNTPSDVLELMETGFKNRARGVTAMNERSSRSHSVVTIHVRGSDLKNGGSIRGSLHLVDLAGSERLDRSEATGDRLKEAQHINKSLSALGDVIFALSQKSSHVPYRNSKLTQVLQSSLGGQAKTLMFVQLNPDVASFSETLSTLKFAERVSGVELGAAKSSKDGKDVRELMEQVASLKDTIGKKDEEIERLQLMKDLKNVNQGGSVNSEKRVTTATSRYGSPSPSSPTLSRNSVGSSSQRNIKLAGGKGSSGLAASASDQDISYTESSDNKHSPVSSQTGSPLGQNSSADHHAEMLGSFGDAEIDPERLSDVSDSALSVGTDTDGSVDSNQFPEGTPKQPESADKPKTTRKLPRPPLRTMKDSIKVSSPVSGLKKSISGSNLATKSPVGGRKWS